MDIKVELLKRELIRKINEELDDFEIDATQIADTTAIKALREIQQILKADEDDFMIVEEIVMVFEKYGLDSLPCHDFG